MISFAAPAPPSGICGNAQGLSETHGDRLHRLHLILGGRHPLVAEDAQVAIPEPEGEAVVIVATLVVPEAGADAVARAPVELGGAVVSQGQADARIGLEGQVEDSLVVVAGHGSFPSFCTCSTVCSIIFLNSLDSRRTTSFHWRR